MVADSVPSQKSIVWKQYIAKGKAKMLGKRIFEERDHKINPLAVSRTKLDIDCNSTKSSSGRPLALAVTGERDRSSPEDLSCLQKKQIAKGGVYAPTVQKDSQQQPTRMATRNSDITAKNSKKRLKYKKSARL